MKYKYIILILFPLYMLLNFEYVHSKQAFAASNPGSSPTSKETKTSTNDGSNDSLEGTLSQVVVAALGGLFGWVFIQCVSLYLLRQKLISYLIVIVNAHLNAYQDIKKWLDAVRIKTLKVGHIVNTAAAFTKDDLDDMKCVRDNCFKLLSKNELIRYIKITHRMWETEVLLEGLCATLTEYKAEKTVLKDTDIDYLNRKIERVLSYIILFPTKITKFKEIPTDFKGVHGAEVLVGSESAKKPADLFKKMRS